MNWNHHPQDPPVDDHGRRTSKPLERDKIDPDVRDCLSAALRLERKIEAHEARTGRKLQHAFVGGVAVAAITRLYWRPENRALPWGVRVFARETKDADIDLKTEDAKRLWEAFGGPLPGGYGPGQFRMKGGTPIWETHVPWKGDIDFDVHANNFRLDAYFEQPNAAFSLPTTRRIPILNDRSQTVGSVSVYKGPLLILLKLHAHTGRHGSDIHKDLLDIRLLIETYDDSRLTLRGASPHVESEFDLDDDSVEYWLNLLKPEQYDFFHREVVSLCRPDKKIAKEVAKWELRRELEKEKNSRAEYDDKTGGLKELVGRYFSSFERVNTWFRLSHHHPERRRQSLAKAGPLALLVWVAYFLLKLLFLTVVRPLRSSLRELPGPSSDAFFSGNLARIFDEEPGVSHLEWQNRYGGAVKYRGFFGEERLILSDPAALNHILLSNCYSYPKPDEVRGELAQILGKGVLFAEGDDHRRQRRIMQPAFSPAHIREYLPIFFERTHKLRDLWMDVIESGQADEAAFKNADAMQADNGTRPQGESVVELTRWLNRLTLDIIGVAGFGYEFNSLEQSGNRLGEAFSTMFSPRTAAKRITIRGILMYRVVKTIIDALPLLTIADWIPLARIQDIKKGFTTLEEESLKIIESKQSAVEKDGLDSIRGSKDLIALLLKSTEDNGKSSMSTVELRGQLTTFLLAGHETTSTATTWTLYTLSQFPDKQDRLRKELRAAREKARAEGRDELESRELDALPYLDAVVREILRLESPVTATIRHAAADDQIPLSSPIPSALDPSRTVSSVPVKKGQVIFIPIAAANKSKKIFGENANEFRPERWMEGEDEGRKIEGGVGLYSHMLTFLAGPRGCIGYRFALLELKAILSVLLDDFEFSLRNEDMEIRRRSQIVTRPLIVDEEELGVRMPLRIRRAKRDE
ncbi:hypothetical protein JCM8547_003270 [Rhodosporidiobolus lusitaniae]